MSGHNENAALFKRLMKIHSNPPILYNGFKKETIGEQAPLSDHATQPCTFKVEYHHITTQHTHCYSQCVSMCEDL